MGVPQTLYTAADRAAYREWADAQVCRGCDTPGCGPGCGQPAKGRPRGDMWVTETCCWRCHFKTEYRPLIPVWVTRSGEPIWRGRIEQMMDRDDEWVRHEADRAAHTRLRRNERRPRRRSMTLISRVLYRWRMKLWARRIAAWRLERHLATVGVAAVEQRCSREYRVCIEEMGLAWQDCRLNCR